MKTPRFWQSNNLVSTALLPAAALYSIGAWLDRTCTAPKRAPLPILSIGNATAGGAGKTPTTLALIPILQAAGHTPHILTRGYGGSNLTAHRISENDTWQTVGDEALLLAKAAPTWVGRDRLASAQAATNAGATILVCDDALQHHALYKDISLLVIDGPYGFGNGRLLPAGPLREPLSASISRCDAAIMVGDNAKQLSLTLPTFNARLFPKGDTNALRDGTWFAFAGIGRPKKFYATLTSLGATLVGTQDFPDHYAYSESDIRALIDKAESLNARIITTEKDAVKIPAHLQASVAVLKVTLTLETAPDFAAWLTGKLAALPAS